MYQPTLCFILYWWDSSKNPKLHQQCESWPLLDRFALDVKVWYETRWIFHWFSGSSILVFRSSWVRFVFSVRHKLISLELDPYVMSSMTLLNVSPTPGIVATRIGSMADVSAGCPCRAVDWISERWWGIEFCFRNGYHAHLSPTIPGKLFCAILTHCSRVFPHKFVSGNPTTTFSVSCLHIIAAATEVKVLASPISSATSAPGISESHTHLLRLNLLTQTWCTRNIVQGRPETRSSVDWRIGWGFSSLTTSTTHSCSSSFLGLLRTVLDTKLVLSGSRTSSPSTCSWTSLAHWLVCFSSSMIACSCSEVTWADRLILWSSWNSLQCLVFHRQAFGPNDYVEYNQFYALNRNLH